MINVFGFVCDVCTDLFFCVLLLLDGCMCFASSVFDAVIVCFCVLCLWLMVGWEFCLH